MHLSNNLKKNKGNETFHILFRLKLHMMVERFIGFCPPSPSDPHVGFSYRFIHAEIEHMAPLNIHSCLFLSL